MLSCGGCCGVGEFVFFEVGLDLIVGGAEEKKLGGNGHQQPRGFACFLKVQHNALRKLFTFKSFPSTLSMVTPCRSGGGGGGGGGGGSNPEFSEGDNDHGR
jgi:hypothetical protein